MNYVFIIRDSFRNINKALGTCVIKLVLNSSGFCFVGYTPVSQKFGQQKTQLLLTKEHIQPIL